jgi:hypothetical protein
MIGWIQKATNKHYDAQPVAASLFIRSEQLGLEAIPFDLFMDESHGLEFKVSEHPLQNGSVVADHVQRQLRSCTIKGMFSNHSMKEKLESENRDVVEIVDPNTAEANKMTTPRAREMYMKLEALADKKEPLKLVTSLIVYPKMIITSIKSDRGKADGESVKFTMVLREIEIKKIMQVSGKYIYDPQKTNTSDQRLISLKKMGGRKSADEIEADALTDKLNASLLK